MHNSPDRHPDRRSFLAAVAAASAAASLIPDGSAAASSNAAPQGEWDLSWLNDLTGVHKQVFDIGPIGDGDNPLRVVRNYLNAARDVLGKEPPDVNTIVGIAGSGFPINVGDAVWAKYHLGELWQLTDARTGTWATRNIFAGAAPGTPGFDTSAPGLRARGTIFWQCNNALNGVAARLANRTGEPQAAVREELIRGFLPGVRLIPAHTLLIGLVQERGCSYESL